MSKKQTKKTTASKKSTPSKSAAAKAKTPAARASATSPVSAKRGGHAGAAAGSATPLKSEPRLPPAGTTIQKLDRHGAVRCECTVEEGGIRYAGNLYRSLSGAAMAAAKDLGLENKTQNGFTFWGLSKPPRPTGDPLEVLTRAWERYHGRVAAAVTDGVTDANRAAVLTTLKKHAQSVLELHQQVA